MSEFTYTAELTYNKSHLGWDHRLPVPKKISDKFIKEQPDRRAICKIEDLDPFPCALMHDGEGGFYIILNKRIRRNLPKSSLRVKITPDESKYGMSVPKEFDLMLEADQEGQNYFDNLTPGRRRALLHLVGKVKSSQLRAEKAAVIINHLRTRKGHLDFKILQEDFKRASRIT